jgi:hypothetical protein
LNGDGTAFDAGENLNGFWLDGWANGLDFFGFRHEGIVHRNRKTG